MIFQEELLSPELHVEIKKHLPLIKSKQKICHIFSVNLTILQFLQHLLTEGSKINKNFLTKFFNDP